MTSTPSSKNSAKKQEHNRKNKIRDLFEKTGNIKVTFHPKIGTIRHRKSKGPISSVEAEEIKKRWKGELCKKRKITQITTVV